MAKLQVGIIGCGAVGADFAAQLSRADVSVHILGRDGSLSDPYSTIYHAGENGIVVEQNGERVKANADNIIYYDDPSQLPADLDFVFPLTRNHDLTVALVESIKAQCPEANWVSSYNGAQSFLPGLLQEGLQGPLLTIDTEDGALAESLRPVLMAGGFCQYPTNEITVGEGGELVVLRRRQVSPSPTLPYMALYTDMLPGTEAKQAQLIAMMERANCHAACYDSSQKKEFLTLYLTKWIEFNLAGAFCAVSGVGLRDTVEGTLGEMVYAVLREANSISTRLAVEPRFTIPVVVELIADFANYIPSILQHLQKGKLMEIPAILKALDEMGARVGVRTPAIGALISFLERINEVGRAHYDDDKIVNGTQRREALTKYREEHIPELQEAFREIQSQTMPHDGFYESIAGLADNLTTQKVSKMLEQVGLVGALAGKTVGELLSESNPDRSQVKLVKAILRETLEEYDVPQSRWEDIVDIFSSRAVVLTHYVPIVMVQLEAMREFPVACLSSEDISALDSDARSQLVDRVVEASQNLTDIIVLSKDAVQALPPQDFAQYMVELSYAHNIQQKKIVEELLRPLLSGSTSELVVNRLYEVGDSKPGRFARALTVFRQDEFEKKPQDRFASMLLAERKEADRSKQRDQSTGARPDDALFGAPSPHHHLFRRVPVSPKSRTSTSVLTEALQSNNHEEGRPTIRRPRSAGEIGGRSLPGLNKSSSQESVVYDAKGSAVQRLSRSLPTRLDASVSSPDGPFVSVDPNMLNTVAETATATVTADLPSSVSSQYGSHDKSRGSFGGIAEAASKVLLLLDSVTGETVDIDPTDPAVVELIRMFQHRDQLIAQRQQMKNNGYSEATYPASGEEVLVPPRLSADRIASIKNSLHLVAQDHTIFRYRGDGGITHYAIDVSTSEGAEFANYLMLLLPASVQLSAHNSSGSRPSSRLGQSEKDKFQVFTLETAARTALFELESELGLLIDSLYALPPWERQAKSPPSSPPRRTEQNGRNITPIPFDMRGSSSGSPPSGVTTPTQSEWCETTPDLTFAPARRPGSWSDRVGEASPTHFSENGRY